jgi:hypothetical protein
MDASVDMEGSLGAAILGYVTVGLPGSSLTSTVRGAVRKKAGPAWVRPERAYHSEAMRS